MPNNFLNIAESGNAVIIVPLKAMQKAMHSKDGKRRFGILRELK
jgi:hypothetical protein